MVTMDSSKNSISISDERRAYFESLPITNAIDHPVKDYNSFINYFYKLSKKFSENPCVYYQDLDFDGSIVVRTLTYEQVDRISSNLACTLYPSIGSDSVLSLMETHSVHYYILSLAIYKLRIPVLLLSTRNSSQSACNLLKETGAQTLIYGKSYKHIKDDIVKEIGIKHLEVPDINISEIITFPLNPCLDQILDRNFTSADLLKTTLMVHSSGTTGIPKVVHFNSEYLMYSIQLIQYSFKKRNQTELLGGPNDISIYLAPLFHSMGLYANYFPIVRGAAVFFFHQFPPSVDEVFNVIKSMPITKLIAPPSYVTQMLHLMQDTGDVYPFKKIKAVISGGAPTSKATDKFFLKHNINFISLHAMTECIGILSSEFSQNRVDSNTYFFLEGYEDHAYMEPFDEDLYQLIFKAGSFYIAAGFCNRVNGDYATKDLFCKSKVKDNGYIYVGRADDTLIMSSGEKTNPLPIEDVIRTNPIISHCTVIGVGRPCPAALIELDFEIAKAFSLDYILKSIHKTVGKANYNAPRHSLILPEMIKVIPFDKKLPVSDKGTVSRKRALDQFKEDIDEMYSNFLSQSNKKIKTDYNNASSITTIRSIFFKNIYRVLGPNVLLKNDVSLFKQGLTSISAIQLKNYISEDIYEVPQSFFYKHQTITNILNALEEDTLGRKNPISTVNHFEYGITTAVLDKYLMSASEDIISHNEAIGTSFKDNKNHVVLITGTTGNLGAYILSKLLDDFKVKKVYALVRGEEEKTLLNRIVNTFKDRNYSVSKLLEKDRVEAIPMRLEQDNLGLSAELHEKLKSEVTIIHACGWLLDFNQPVSYFDTECIKGLYNLLKFANRGGNSIPFHFISSISASSEKGDRIIHETEMPLDPRIASPMGYGQSKFVVEQLLQYLVRKKNMPCFIYRVGQLCGDKTNGIWNTTEMYPLTLIGGGSYMKKLPDLNMDIDWLPLDIAGDAIISITMKITDDLQSNKAGYIFHIVNPNEVSWSSLLYSLKKCGMEFDIVDPKSWVEELSLQQDNPAYRLLNFYQKAFLNSSKSSQKWELNNTSTLFPEIKDSPTINDLLHKYLAFWRSNGFYTK